VAPRPDPVETDVRLYSTSSTAPRSTRVFFRCHLVLPNRVDYASLSRNPAPFRVPAIQLGRFLPHRSQLVLANLDSWPTGLLPSHVGAG
jgi:hypothetical protein